MVNSDFISNIDLTPALHAHFKGLHDVDKSQMTEEEQARILILTKTLIQTDFIDPARSSTQDLFLLQNARTKEVLNYKSLEKWRNVALNLDHISFKQSKTIKYEARHDLIDTEINICSHDLLKCFTDNFDYENMKDDFVLHVAESEL